MRIVFCASPRIGLLLLLLFVMKTDPMLSAADDKPAFTQPPAIAPAQVRDEKPSEVPKTKPAPKQDGPKPQWIWGPDNNRAYTLSKEFPGGAQFATLTASCDNQMEILINGQSVAKSDAWQQPVEADVRKYLKKRGQNVLSIRVQNQGGSAGLAAKLALIERDGHQRSIVTDKTWHATEDDAEVAVRSVGTMGDKPWGDVFAQQAGNGLPNVPRDVFQVLPGFQVELLYTVPKDTLGSWVCLTVDDKGRLLASDQGDLGLCRITPPPIGSQEPTQVEPLDLKLSAAQGMVHAFGSLYLSINGGPGSGFYRARDTNGDDQFDEVTKLKDIHGGGEHGPHAVRLSPDGKSLYVVAGNHTKLPQDVDASRLPSNWGEDLLLPRQWDAKGHARGVLAPGGWIAKTDPDGKTWEIVSNGYRNAYDMDFNADGELFAYDSDMEWDMGMPWYRPTRATHATSGSEFGWRSGTGKWPAYSVDSLPPLADIGPGSPVGVTFGYGAKFPAKYQQALYLLDWTFGTIYALHLEPEGASYKAVKEEFLSRTPLPLTDAVVAPDGALYFTVGGRGTQSELYRVTYVGQEATAPANAKNATFQDQRELRHRLEALHHPGDVSEQQLAEIWTQLEHKDRFIRYAARVALEHRNVETWRGRLQDAAQQANRLGWTIINAAVALARQGEPADQPLLLEALEQLDFAKLPKEQKLGLLRAYGLTFIRLGEPDYNTRLSLANRFDPFFPANENDLDRELCQLLVYLQSPTIITKTLKLMEQDTPPSKAEVTELLARNAGYGGTIAKMLANLPDKQKLHYAFVLRNLRYGWTLEQRQAYLQWLDAARGKSGGASYEGFIDNVRKDALANASEAELLALKSTIADTQPKPTSLPKAVGPGHNWVLDEVVALTKDGLRDRDFENGRRTYAAARCVMCHRFGGDGGATGPDLTNVAGRFSFKDLTEAIVDPSKVISDQYRGSKILTSAGTVIAGRIVSEADGVLTVITDPEDATKVAELRKSEIEEVQPSSVSLMPNDLLKTLNKEELLDLLAYLQSRGNPQDPMFRQGSEVGGQ